MNAVLLKNAGIDYDAGLARFMDDEALYEAVLTAFVEDDLLARARAAFENGKRDQLLDAVHEAKGSSGNAGLEDVYAEASALTALLRGAYCSQYELEAHFRRFEKAYADAREGIRAALLQSST